MLVCLLAALGSLSSRGVAQDFNATDAARVQEAQAAIDASQYQRAVDLLRSLQPHYPAAPELPQMLAHAYLELEQFDSARQAALQALRLGRLSPDILARLARVYQESGDDVALMNTVRLLTVLEPGTATWRMIYGDLLAAAGLLGESAAVFAELVAEQPASAELNLRLGNAQMQMGNLSLAVVSFETAWHLGATDPQIALTIAGHWQQLDAPRQALQWYERYVASSDSADAEVQLQMAMLYYQVKERNAATATARRLTETDDAALRSRAHVLLGQIAVEQNRIEEAIRHWQDAVEQGSPAPALSAAIGAHFFNQGDYGAAAKHLSRATAEDDPAEEHLRFLILSLIRGQDLTAARAALQRYVEHHGLRDEAKDLVQLWASAKASR